MTVMNSLKNRSGKARNRAIFAGLLYLLGTMCFAVAAFLPLSKGVEVTGYGTMSVLNFWKPIAYLITTFKSALANPAEYILIVLAGLLYGLMLLFTLINALRSISKLDHLCMKGNKRAGFNQNKLAVDKMGKIFSCSYALLAIHTLWIMAMFPSAEASFTMLFYATSGVFLLIHLLGGAIAGSISKFTARETVAELPRKHRMGAPVLRNLLQFGALGGIAFFLQGFMPDALSSILVGWANPVVGGKTVVSVFQAESAAPGIFRLLSLGLWLGGFICYLVVLRHAINPTEFYACDKQKGRKTVRFWGFNLFLALLLLALLPVISLWVTESKFPAIWEVFGGELNLLYATAIALGLFILECILRKRPLLKKRYREQTEEELDEDFLIYDVDEEFPLLSEEESEAASVAAPVEAPVAVPAAATAAVASQPAVAPAPKEKLPLSPRAVRAREVKEKWIAKSKTAGKNKPQQS